jgi:hypothetical protein
VAISIYELETASATAKIRNCEPRFTLMDKAAIVGIDKDGLTLMAGIPEARFMNARVSNARAITG